MNDIEKSFFLSPEVCSDRLQRCKRGYSLRGFSRNGDRRAFPLRIARCREEYGQEERLEKEDVLWKCSSSGNRLSIPGEAARIPWEKQGSAAGFREGKAHPGVSGGEDAPA